MQAIQARSPCSSAGTSPERVRSARPMLPPGRSTRANALAAALLFGKVQKAHSQMTASNWSSAHARRSASPCSKRTRWATPAASATRVASPTASCPNSTPNASQPNCCARKMALAPLPAATSRRRLPGPRSRSVPRRLVSGRPPGWNDSPSSWRAQSLAYAAAQQALTSSAWTPAMSSVLVSMRVAFLTGACPHVDALTLRAIARASMIHWLIKRKRQWRRSIRGAVKASTIARSFACCKLLSCLLAIADAVVRAKRNLLPVGQENFLTALHQVLLVKGPGVHEVLQHDHEDMLGKGAHIKPICQATCGTRKRELLGGFL